MTITKTQRVTCTSIEKNVMDHLEEPRQKHAVKRKRDFQQGLRNAWLAPPSFSTASRNGVKNETLFTL